jgi:multicomponent Na+:H+ antiporter subunit D
MGIAFLYSYTSTLNMAQMASAILARDPQALVLRLVAVLFLMGFGLKSALAPFHSWLPYAHSSAPAPVSAMLSGVSIKVLGVYALARIFFNVLGMSPAVASVVTALAVLSMIGASLIAFAQADVKRLFAYSSISQIGYIALGLGLGTPLGILGALFHLANHSVFKSLLFLNSGAIERAAGTRDLGRIRGIVSGCPLVGYTNVIASSSICGIPPFGGFWSKLLIIFACIQAQRPALALAACAAGALTLAYYFKALTPALFGPARQGVSTKRGAVTFYMAAPMVVLAFLSAFGFMMLLPNRAGALLKNAASSLSDGRGYAVTVSEAYGLRRGGPR